MGTRLISALTAVLILGCMCCALPALADDGVPFQVLQPLPNFSISGTKLPIAVRFQNPSDAEVTRFESFLDGERLVWGRIRYPEGQPTRDFSFRTEADLSELQLPVAAGVHTLVIKLYDTLGRVSQNQVSVVVPTTTTVATVPGAAPTVKIVKPAAAGTITGKTDIQVDVQSAAGIKFVIVTIDGKVYGVTTEAPYTIPWDPAARAFAPGAYTLVASAIDLFDNKGTSQPITITFDPSARTVVNADLICLSPMSPLRPTGASDAGRPWQYGSLQPTNTWNAGETRPPGLQFPTSVQQAFAPSEARQVAMLPMNKAMPGMLDSAQLDVMGTWMTSRAPALSGGSAVPPAGYLAGLSPTRGTVLLPGAQSAALRPDGESAHPVLVALLMPSVRFSDPMTVASSFPEPMLGSVSAAALPSDVTGRARPKAVGPQTPELVTGSPADEVPVTLQAMRVDSTLPHVTLLASAPLLRTPGVATPSVTETVATTSTGAVHPQPASNPTRPATAGPAAPLLTPGSTPAAALTLGPVARSESIPPAVPVVGSLPHLQTPAAETPVLIARLTPATSGVVTPSLATSPARQGTPEAVAPGLPVAAISPLSEAGVGVRSEATAPTASLAMLSQGTGKQTPGGSDAVVLVAGTPKSMMTGLAPLPTGAGPLVAVAVGPTVDPRAPRTVGPPEFNTSAAPAPARTAVHPTTMTTDPLTKSTPAMGVVESGPSVKVAMLPGTSAGTPNTAPTPVELTALPEAPTLPTTEVGVTALTMHTAQPGETVLQIALAHNTTPAEIEKLNPGLSPERVPAGTKVLVPVPGVHFYLDGTPVAGRDGRYPDPYILNSTSMVPFRLLVEAKGGKVEWLPATQEVNAWADDTFIGVKVGEQTARINAETVTLTEPVTLVDARTMVPVRFMMAALNLELEYNASSGTYSLITKDNQ
jgi:LysM repeat protein